MRGIVVCGATGEGCKSLTLHLRSEINMEAYDVIELSLGEKTEGDKIVFKSIEDMEQAYKDIDNGKNIYVKKDGLVTKILNQMVTNKIYDGSIRLSAKTDE